MCAAPTSSVAEQDHFDTDPDPAFYFDPDPDPTFQFDMYPVPTVLYRSRSSPFQTGNVPKTILFCASTLIFLDSASNRTQPNAYFVKFSLPLHIVVVVRMLTDPDPDPRTPGNGSWIRENGPDPEPQHCRLVL